MKKLLSLLLILFVSVNYALAQKGPVFEFADVNDTYDFGTVTDGDVVVYEYKFKNTGDQPLMIYNAEAGCNCTSATWSKTPVMPGQSGAVKVTYKSEGNVGKVNKQVYIKSNAKLPTKYKSRYEINLLGNVKAKK